MFHLYDCDGWTKVGGINYHNNFKNGRVHEILLGSSVMTMCLKAEKTVHYLLIYNRVSGPYCQLPVQTKFFSVDLCPNFGVLDQQFTNIGMLLDHVYYISEYG